jgi:hypothetical protein
VGLRDIIARPNVAPRPGQSPAPPTWTSKAPVEDSDAARTELERILALQRRPAPTPGRELAMRMRAKDRFSRGERKCSCATLAPHRKEPCIRDLRPIQAWALFELEICSGLFAPIGVGHGKTLLDLLAPLVVPECRRAVLLLPVSVADQLRYEYELIREHWQVPSLVVHGGDYVAEVPGAPELHVVPYSRLSLLESSELLDQLDPDLVIADECDLLSNPESSRTRRMRRLMDSPIKSGPLAGRRRRFVGMTGSPTESSMMDYQHLANWALAGGSPVPRDPDVAKDWARCLDPGKEGGKDAPAGPLLRLCREGEHVRDAFRKRLLETPGWVSAAESSCDTELTMEERAAPALPKVIQEALEKLRAEKVRPDGEELIEEGDAFEVTACACELAAGFYYTWEFRRGESPELVREWLGARKAWRRELRGKLEENIPLLDSPQLCAYAAARAWSGHNPDGKPEWRAQTWSRWAAIKDLVKPETVPVRLSDFLVQDAAAWAREDVGIVWYESRALGEWIAEVSGLTLHTGGPKAGKRILREDGKQSIIASINSHGRGRDGLQYLFRRQLVTQPPSGGRRWQQLLGRLHRPGQGDPVHCWFYAHTDELQKRMEIARSRASYTRDTMGHSQKLLQGGRP